MEMTPEVVAAFETLRKNAVSDFELHRISEFEEDLIVSGREVWKDIEGYEGLYQVSNKGRVKSFYYSERLVRLTLRNGYFSAALSKNGKKNIFRVSRLVAQAFIPNPKNLPVVNNKDGNRQNNCVENLEWVTVSENTLHTYRELGYKNPRRKLTEEQVREIRKVYKARDRKFGGEALARKYGVDDTVISWVANNKSYKDVK